MDGPNDETAAGWEISGAQGITGRGETNRVSSVAAWPVPEEEAGMSEGVPRFAVEPSGNVVGDINEVPTAVWAAGGEFETGTVVDKGVSRARWTGDDGSTSAGLIPRSPNFCCSS